MSSSSQPRATQPVALLLALVGGLVAATAFEPWATPYASPVGIALFTLATRKVRGARAAAIGGGFGLAFMGATCWWLWASIGPAAWAALTVVQALWFAALGVGLGAVRRLRGWPCWAALLWTAVEVLRSTWPFGGMPWGRLGFAVVDSVWAATVPWLGVTGAGFLVALTGTALAAAVSPGPTDRLGAPGRRRVVAGTLAAVPVLSAAAAPVPSLGDPETVRVGVVQGGVPGSGTRLIEHHREVTRNHLDQTRALAAGLARRGSPSPDFVLWPENATAVDVTRDAEAAEIADDAVAAAGAPVLVGSVVDGPSRTTAANQGIVWDEDGPGPRYTKQHLVPFGEYVPFRGLAVRLSSRVAAISRDMLPGEGARPLMVAGRRVADALCFDVAYDDVIGPQVRQGADLVTVQTSNAMFLGTAQLEQQWAITRTRALETGRAVVVASVNGISGAITPDGQVLARLPVRESSNRVVEVPVSGATTLATVLGPWPGRSALALAAGGLLLAFRRRRLG